MLLRWLNRRRDRVERVEPLLLAPSGADGAPGAATNDGPSTSTGSLVVGSDAPWASEGPSKAPALGRPDSDSMPTTDSGPRRIHAPGALRAPEGASMSAPELSRMHARLLLRWVADSDWTHPAARADVVAVDDGKPVLLASALLEIYREMCAEKGVAERPWNPIAKELRALTGDRKGYAWIERDGVKHRLRVYRIDVVLAGPSGARPAPGPSTSKRAEDVGRVIAPDAPWASEGASRERAA